MLQARRGVTVTIAGTVAITVAVAVSMLLSIRGGTFGFTEIGVSIRSLNGFSEFSAFLVELPVELELV